MTPSDTQQNIWMAEVGPAAMTISKSAPVPAPTSVDPTPLPTFNLIPATPQGSQTLAVPTPTPSVPLNYLPPPLLWRCHPHLPLDMGLVVRVRCQLLMRPSSAFVRVQPPVPDLAARHRSDLA